MRWNWRAVLDANPWFGSGGQQLTLALLFFVQEDNILGCGEKKKRGRPKAPYEPFSGRLNIRLSKEDISALERLSKERGLSKSTLARLAILHFINGNFIDY